MGNILKVNKLTTFAEVLVISVVLAVVLTGVYFFAPGLRVSGSKTLNGLTVNGDDINNVSDVKEMELPSTNVSTKVSNLPLLRIAEYAWNGNIGCIGANGGPRTTKGSIMESLNVNLEIVRLDGVSDLRNRLVNFVGEFDKGTEHPNSDKTAFAVSIMGDGVPFFISTTQEAIDAKFGKNKYHVQSIGAIGASFGEDKLIGPRIWKDNPKSMEGALISSVVGDGDWVVAINYAFANKLNVNTDVTTYDPHAVNFTPSKDDDYINSVKELISSQNQGTTVELKEVVNGKLTGKKVNRKIDGATTWTPGDKLAFDQLKGFTDIISTKEFNNQMATTIVTIKEFALKNDKTISNILKGSYMAGDQIKKYDNWLMRSSEAVAKTYNFENGKYWYDLFKGQKGTKDGVDYNVGGSKVFNYSDALQYFGISDGVNRYKSVYDQVSTYLVQLNPCGFNENCKSGVVPYDDAVNLYFMKSINDIASAKAEKVDYTQTKTTILADGNWSINFETGSSEIKETSTKDLETIYNLLIQAENTKLQVVGHTDNSGNPQSNLTLSKGRANSVVNYLTAKGIPSTRFQLIDGKGQDEPIADNNTPSGKAKNRRVQITLMK
jgi:outer membrane protein OmpA-like peptidoglycan-associated protein